VSFDSLLLVDAEEPVFFSAALAPATAWGLSRPVMLLSFLCLGCGSMLVRREEARELAGRVAVLVESSSEDFEGCRDARRLFSVDIDAAEDRRGLDRACWEYGPGDARRSLNDSRLAGLDGVSSGIGELEEARRGLRMGSFDEEGVRAETERTEVGVVLA